MNALTLCRNAARPNKYICLSCRLKQFARLQPLRPAFPPSPFTVRQYASKKQTASKKSKGDEGDSSEQHAQDDTSKTTPETKPKRKAKKSKDVEKESGETEAGESTTNEPTDPKDTVKESTTKVSTSAKSTPKKDTSKKSTSKKSTERKDSSEATSKKTTKKKDSTEATPKKSTQKNDSSKATSKKSAKEKDPSEVTSKKDTKEEDSSEATSKKSTKKNSSEATPKKSAKKKDPSEATPKKSTKEKESSEATSKRSTKKEDSSEATSEKATKKKDSSDATSKDSGEATSKKSTKNREATKTKSSPKKAAIKQSTMKQASTKAKPSPKESIQAPASSSGPSTESKETSEKPLFRYAPGPDRRLKHRAISTHPTRRKGLRIRSFFSRNRLVRKVGTGDISQAVQVQKHSPRRKRKRRSRTAADVDGPVEKVDFGSLPRLTADRLSLDAIPIQRPPVARLAHGLERVLFNPGVCHVRDPRTRVFNVDPHLEKLMPVREFDFSTLNIFTPPSKDAALARIASQSQKRYLASTSSLTGVLKHFHYLLSRWRPINFNMLSKGFPTLLSNFTRLQRAPDAVFLRWKDGMYAIDADKRYDSPNILSLMGRYMEKLLLLNKDEFFRHKVGSENPVTEKERHEPEAFHYSTLGDFILRSQLDAHDPRLPGSGIFDLKTRAVVPIRMNSENHESGVGYEIRSLLGEWQSFEREYYDMIRSTLLKYSLQVRMGRMDGIFVAFHNIERIFGFQYLSLDEMDLALHGQSDRSLGDQEFNLSLRLLNEVFNRATETFPEQSIRFHFEARETSPPRMYIFAKPVTDAQADQVQTTNKNVIEKWERDLLQSGPADQQNPNDPDPFNVEQDVTSELLPHPNKDTHLSSEQGPPGKSERPVVWEYTSGLSTLSNQGVPLCQELFNDTKTVASAEVPEAPSNPPHDPLLAFTLQIYSKVNDTHVFRPHNTFTAEDTWNVSYKLEPIADEQRARALYTACKNRRHKELTNSKDKKEESTDYFRDMLKQMTQEGRAWRRKVEKQERKARAKGKEASMWDEPLGAHQKREGRRTPSEDKRDDEKTQKRWWHWWWKWWFW